MDRSWIAWLMGVLASLAVVLDAGVAHAQLSYAKEDLATVRVLAVAGAVRVDVPIPGKKPVALASVVGGHGSGVLVSADGLILTAAHVVDQAEFVAVKVPEQSEAIMARVVYENPRRDIAFIKIPGTYSNYLTIPPVEPTLTARQQVFALGYPLDGTRAYPQSTAGVIAGLLPDGDLQLAMSVNPGNSGGPLIDQQANLLGLVVRRGDPNQGIQGIAHALPISAAEKYADRVQASSRMARARADEATTRRQTAAAEFIAQIASVSSLGAAVEYIEDQDGTLKSTLQKALQTHGKDPDFLALIAAHYWNEALVRRVLDGRNWQAPLSRSAKFARAASARDQAVLHRSPFLYAALGRSEKDATVARYRAASGLAGFRLGISVSDARVICELEDLTFKRLGKSYYSCSASPVGRDFSGPVVMQFQADKLTRLSISDRPSRQLSKVWVEKFKEIYGRLEGQLGSHSKLASHFPKGCKENVLACVESGKARISYRWEWGDRSMKLALGRLKGEPTILLLLEEKP